MNGFTLIELVVVILILTIVSAVVILRAPSRSSFDLDAWADILVRDIRYTQTLSTSLNQSYRIAFASQRYAIQDENSQNHQHPASDLSYMLLPSGMTLSSTQATVVFDGLGVPRNTSGTALNQITTITLSVGSEQKTVTITPQTGFAND